MSHKGICCLVHNTVIVWYNGTNGLFHSAIIEEIINPLVAEGLEII